MLRTASAALLGGLTLCAPARASTVVIWPVDPVIAADGNAAALWLENKGRDEVILQVRALGWDQRTGDDVLSPQDEVVASPPLARVAPGGRQMVRLIRRGPPAVGVERSLRILVDELPAPVAGDAGPGLSARLGVQMRYSIPLFLYGTPAATPSGAPRLSFRAVTEGDRRYVEIANTGGRHARITDLRAGPAGRDLSLRAGLAGYVLAGATVRWAVPAGVPLPLLLAGINGVEQSITPAS